MRAARQDGLGHRDVEGRQQTFRFHLGEHLSALGQHAFDHQARALDVGLGQGTQRRRRLLQQLLVLVEAAEVAKRADCRLGRAEGGDGGTAEGESVSHHFGYPGTYDVIVDIAHDKFAASDEIIVTAAPAAIVFSILADGGVEIANESGHELDLSGWVVRKDSGLFSPMFVLPSHSRVVADAAMRIAPDTLGFKAGPDVSLEYPNGSHAFSVGERLQELRAPIQDASVTAKTPVVSTVLSSKNVVASKSIKRIRTVSKGSIPTQSDSEEGVDPSVSPQTNVAQSASVAQSEALSPWWWVGALALAGVAGMGVIVAKKAAKKEWNIIEDTSE